MLIIEMLITLLDFKRKSNSNKANRITQEINVVYSELSLLTEAETEFLQDSEDHCVALVKAVKQFFRSFEMHTQQMPLPKGHLRLSFGLVIFPSLDLHS